MKTFFEFSPANIHLRAVLLCLLANLHVLFLMPVQVHAQGYKLLTTFTNPAPANLDSFGESMAPLGNDQIIIGTYSEEQNSSGKAYLFRADGTLVTTFSNPHPSGDYFGLSVSAFGSDRVLIGAPFALARSGSAYLFATNGSLLTTFTNPNPTKSPLFGETVAPLGNDRVLIYADSLQNGPGPYLNAVYLFQTNGTLLTTITNPAPTTENFFGYQMVAVGNDRIFISAIRGEGKAYLYDTNATLIMTFSDPNPGQGGRLGSAVATLGGDRVLIGKTGEDVNGPGAVYLFNTNGTLLKTFTSGMPEGFDGFGISLAVVGSDRVLIGAYNKTFGSAFNAGAAYLFNTNGVLLNIYTNSTPALNGWFGYSLGATGNGQVFVGSPTYYTDRPIGTAYLFSAPGPVPPLSIARNAGTISVSWVAAETGLVLQQTASLGTSNVWSDATNSVSVTGSTNVVQQTNGPGKRFFRLYRP